MVWVLGERFSMFLGAVAIGLSSAPACTVSSGHRDAATSDGQAEAGNSQETGENCEGAKCSESEGQTEGDSGATATLNTIAERVQQCNELVQTLDLSCPGFDLGAVLLCEQLARLDCDYESYIACLSGRLDCDDRTLGSVYQCHTNSDCYSAFYDAAYLDGADELGDWACGELKCSPGVADSCPEGEKCQPWSCKDYPRYDGARCVPTLEPEKDDKFCYGNPMLGVDDCPAASWCIPSGNLLTRGEGLCHAMCHPWRQGGPEYCEDFEGQLAHCFPFGDGATPFCARSCDPLEPGACEREQSCYFVTDHFMCLTPYTRLEPEGKLGLRGDACHDEAGCEPGLSCVPDSLYTECESECTENGESKFCGCCLQPCALDGENGCLESEKCTPFNVNPPPDVAGIGACTPRP